jgi:c(7)-type cytochrome triheme protein
MKPRAWISRAAAIALVLGIASVALAGTLPKLPPDFAFPQGDGSPGIVTFSHASHVDDKRPACTGCHPALFKILQPGTTADGSRIVHTSMEAKRYCGACHNDAGAFGLGQCDLCHRSK